MIIIIDKINVCELIAIVGMVAMGIYSVSYHDTQITNIVVGGLLGWLGKGAINDRNNTK